ncbi:hypothetical protein CDD81_3789 [Ophiocordyceps australis]|uniref:Small ribosomal subunit protein mS41 n=1 Tax=Ophiocordyceps australis TaxID=1399860 RepID=A0A2C5YCF0_9HYPO|nr:hypothetical protein CDD81_3789 [Ophiocordyceps australis]
MFPGSCLDSQAGTMRCERLRPYLRLLSPRLSSPGIAQSRWLHQRKELPIPRPLPFVPDVQTFLTLIGRGLSKHASKFPSWESLFTLSAPQLQELGIEPPRTRRYLVHWIQRYRCGAFGPGADFQYVKNGEALLKIASTPATKLVDLKWVVNVPPEGQAMPNHLHRPASYTVSGLKTISGPYAVQLPGNAGAVVKVTEGMWEDRQGYKVDGGERRQAMIRAKKRSAARRAERESALSGAS